MKFPVKAINTGHTRGCSVWRGGQLSVTKEEGIVVWRVYWIDTRRCGIEFLSGWTKLGLLCPNEKFSRDSEDMRFLTDCKSKHCIVLNSMKKVSYVEGQTIKVSPQSLKEDDQVSVRKARWPVKLPSRSLYRWSLITLWSDKCLRIFLLKIH